VVVVAAAAVVDVAEEDVEIEGLRSLSCSLAFHIESLAHLLSIWPGVWRFLALTLCVILYMRTKSDFER
jgi:hypothetical protein